MTERLAFLDWMKVTGMGLIVWGHTGGHSLLDPTRVFNVKQLGVAFFMYVLGFTLVREHRARTQVCFNRLFPIGLIGIVIAILLSCLSLLIDGNLRESDFLPFFLGANVFFDHFPANPTTWFIGTYIHAVLLWWIVLDRLPLSPVGIAGWLLLEILVRVLLMRYVGHFVAYMLLVNWMGVFLAGLYAGRRRTTRSDIPWKSGLLTVVVGMCLTAWSFLIPESLLIHRFPFSVFNLQSDGGALLLTSTCVSVLYLGVTLAVAEIVRPLPSLPIVSLLARNTLFVFIIHMPMIYALVPYYYPFVPSPVVRVPCNMLIFYVGPALVSEMFFQRFPIKVLRDRVYDKMFTASVRNTVASSSD